MSSAAPLIVLASQSPRRRTLLEQIGVKFSVEVADIDETRGRGEPTVDYVARLAHSKALAVRDRLAGERVILGADTVVTVDDEALGKPASRQDAERMLARLSGRRHEVLTAVALVTTRSEIRVNRTRVWFRDIGAAERRAYVHTGEPMDKAGAYAIQGRAAAFIERIDGSYSGVMGLPLFETAVLLADAGALSLADD